MYDQARYDRETINRVLESHDPVHVMEEVRTRLIEERTKREQFYNLVHEDVKAEFIAGEIVFHSPVRTSHWRVSTRITRLLSAYVMDNRLGDVGVEKVMVSIGRHDFEPDIVFFNKEVASQFTPDQKLFPAPQLAVEILSDSTEARDRGIKFREYALAGVQEYWIVDAERNQLEQYFNTDAAFVLHKTYGPTGALASLVVPGFRLDLAAVFEG